jgi:hypothetical protein
MKSPFPGMDPYLERRWGDVHTRLCAQISARLQSLLPSGLRARTQEDVLLEDDAESSSAYFEPDISVIELPDADDLEAVGAVAVATQPIAVRHVRLPKRQRWIEILDSSDGYRLVTAIEILSPGNKAAGALNRSYLNKIRRYTDGAVNVVEIDLLRSRRDRLAVPESEIPDDRHADYYTSICRAKDRSLWLVYPMKLRDPLPAIPIPCREKDRDVVLELQPIMDQIYIDGAHDDLKYDEPPEPPFSKADAKWAAGLIAKWRKNRKGQKT